MLGPWGAFPGGPRCDGGTGGTDGGHLHPLFERSSHSSGGGHAQTSTGQLCYQIASKSSCRAAPAAHTAPAGSDSGSSKCNQRQAAHAGFGSLIEQPGDSAGVPCCSSGGDGITAASRSGSDGLSGGCSSGTWFEDHLDLQVEDPQYDLERAYHDHLAFQGSQEQPQLCFAACPPAVAAGEQRGTRPPPTEQGAVGAAGAATTQQQAPSC